jgi:hypothetical protein
MANKASSTGLGSGLDKHNGDRDKTRRLSQFLLSITCHEDYDYHQIWYRSIRHGRALWSWPSGQSWAARLGRTQKLDYFRARGLLPPGSYSHQNKKPATIAVTKAREGIRDQKQIASKSAKRSTQGVRLANADGE